MHPLGLEPALGDTPPYLSTLPARRSDRVGLSANGLD